MSEESASSEETEVLTSTEIIEISDTIIDTTSNASNHTIILNKKSGSGLSAGAICGIVIPCVAGLLGATVAAALLKGGSAACCCSN